MGTSVRSYVRPSGWPEGEVAAGPAGLGRRPRPLPVAGPLAVVLPEGGLVRGSVVACTGGAAVSLALALVAGASRDGSWLAVVDLPWLGAEAASEAGVALDRLVRIDAGSSGVGSAGARLTGVGWAERVAAAMGGFELILTRVPRRVPDRSLRQVRQRLRAAGGVLVDVAPAGSVVAGAEVIVDAAVDRWVGIGRGSGHLRQRVVEVVVSGRRAPRPRHLAIAMPLGMVGVGGEVMDGDPVPELRLAPGPTPASADPGRTTGTHVRLTG